jgi:hypothetical protein
MDVPAKLLQQSALLAKQAAELIKNHREQIQNHQQQILNEIVNEPTDETGSQTNPEQPPEKFEHNPPIRRLPMAPTEEPKEPEFFRKFIRRCVEDGEYSSLPANSAFLKKSTSRGKTLKLTESFMREKHGRIEYFQSDRDGRDIELKQYFTIPKDAGDVTQLKYIKFKNFGGNSLQSIVFRIGFSKDDLTRGYERDRVMGITNKYDSCILKSRVIGDEIVYEIPDFFPVIPNFLLKQEVRIEINCNTRCNLNDVSLHCIDYYRTEEDKKYFLNRNYVLTRFPYIHSTKIETPFNKEIIRKTANLSFGWFGKSNGFFVTYKNDNGNRLTNIKVKVNCYTYLELNEADIEMWCTRVSDNCIYVPLDGNKDYNLYYGKNSINFDQIDEVSVEITHHNPTNINNITAYTIENTMAKYGGGYFKCRRLTDTFWF